MLNPLTTPRNHLTTQPSARRCAPVERETLCEVVHSLPPALNAPLDETYAATKQFIHDHPFFHEGLMDLPIGGGKHFRNVPFIGPSRVIWGALTLNTSEMAKGLETTRGTWDAE